MTTGVGKGGGVHVELAELVKLRQQPKGYTLLPRQPAQSVLAGQHGSKLRGRGLDFSELKAYQTGDDTRNIDWKVTARMRKPYARVYNEERERPVLLVIDQRLSMFFGSKLNFKSVTAAQVAAACVWRVLEQRDRVGAVVFNDRQIVCIEPRRSEGTGMQILQAVVKMNQALSWTRGIRANPEALNEALGKARQLATHDFLVAQITDGFGRDAKTRQINSAIAAHNDLIFSYIYDPMEVELPEGDGLVVGDGVRQMELAAGASAREKFRAGHDRLVDEISRFWIGRQMPVLPISCAEPTLPQLRRMLTQGPAGGARSKA